MVDASLSTVPVHRDLKIVVDQPTKELGLGYDKYVDALAAVVRNGDPARYTVGIYGAWGVGKSSILRALEDAIANKDLPVASFDAWRYARNPNVLVPLLHEIDRVVEGKSEPFWKGFARGLRAITAELTLPTPFGSISGAAIGNAVTAVSRAAREPIERRYVEVPHDRLRELGDDLTKANQRIVVLVDDLDRCPPDTIVDILEAVHFLTDVQGFVFVLALDYEVLVDAIRLRYPSVDAALFIEKIIQIPFWIPEVDRGASVINEVVRGWDTMLGLDAEDQATLERVVHLALRTNPRQVKRLVNSMLVAQHILGAGSAEATDRSTLIAVTGLQLRWPAQFKDLHRALLANPDNDLLGDFDADLASFAKVPGLSEYVAAVLPPELSRGQVLAAMKYSQTTASAPAQSESDPVVDETESGQYQYEIAEPHQEWFKWVCDKLGSRGAMWIARQQYIVFKIGTRAFLRVDGYERIGLRLFFPDWLHIDDADLERFTAGSGGRAGNFSKTLVLDDDTRDLALEYMVRALQSSPGWRRPAERGFQG
ncbi:P-loop NTPase fold protein [Curtobacterium sp. MCJR17_020]|uniref:KAP family P-loop NTPase fold protein n=1 Tax=Curtobacterium sp. MCJR17_020 TaxID=2175619 RepID=UPI000DA85AFC|nr:P-loop NTPase fold protein [Curtobacterium sp. MCJR17_020]WIE71593.1 P-loop NTPase fold protein [Curtobacterium sp. MCJR17_020]